MNSINLSQKYSDFGDESIYSSMLGGATNARSISEDSIPIIKLSDIKENIAKKNSEKEMFKQKEMQYKDEINRLNKTINDLKTEKNLNGGKDTNTSINSIRDNKGRYLYLDKLNNFHKLMAVNNALPMITMFNRLIGGTKNKKKVQLVELSNIYQRAGGEIDAIYKSVSKNIREDRDVTDIDKINTRVDELVTLRKNIQDDLNKIGK